MTLQDEQSSSCIMMTVLGMDVGPQWSYVFKCLLALCKMFPDISFIGNLRITVQKQIFKFIISEFSVILCINKRNFLIKKNGCKAK